MIKVEYDSNNSGGSWWLKDEDWKNLEKAGWKVDWFINRDIFGNKRERFLGALADSASKEFISIESAIREFEEITKQDTEDQGCPCCGPPHTFRWEDENGELHYK